MFDSLRSRLADAFENDNASFFTKLLFLSIIVGLFIGLLVSSVSFLVVKIPFVKNTALFFVLVALAAGSAGLGFFLFFKMLLRKGLLVPLQHFNFAVDGSWGYLLHSINTFKLHEARDGLLRLLEEERLAVENYEKNYKLVGSQYGLWLPDEQLHKIMEDEDFYALKGRQRETYVVALGFAGGFSVLLDEKQESSAKFFSQVISKGVQFAKADNLLFADFSSDYLLFCADLPYAVGVHRVKKIFKAAQTWMKQVVKIAAQLGFDIEPFAFFHHGDLYAGQLSVEYMRKYQFCGPVIDYLFSHIKTLPMSGVVVSDAFCDFFSIDKGRDDLESLSDGIYQYR